jgi:hypothetical protein
MTHSKDLTLVRVIVLVALVCLLILTGCGQSNKAARQAYDRGTDVNEQVRQAFFVKSWGLNRALITEARRKWVNEATIGMLEAVAEGKIDAKRAREIVSKLETDLGEDETIASQNFAYLAFLLTLGERADAELGNVDFYLEAQRPIWSTGSETVRGTAADVAAEIKAWEPLVKDLRAVLPNSLIDQVISPSTKSATKPPE